MLVFLTFVWFTMKFVWPPLEKVLEERRTKIAEGLAAAERSRRELELTQHRISEDLKLARAKSAEIIEKASFRAAQLVEEAKEEAVRQSEHIAKVAQEHLQQEVNRARDNLRKDIGKLAVAGAERILMREINEEVNKALI